MNSYTKGTLTIAVGIALALPFVLSPERSVQAADTEMPEVSHDGLHLVVDSKAAVLYVKPDADFSAYDQFMILDCFVAFKKDWQKDFNRGQRSGGGRVSDKDMERMRNDIAELFRDVFVDELTENDGYELVDAAAAKAILIRPAIIDLEATAPDTQSGSRNYTFVDSAGAATLYIELYDSVTREILARAIDRKADRGHGRMQWSTRGSNRADAKQILRTWAGWLRERMDEVHGKVG